VRQSYNDRHAVRHGKKSTGRWGDRIRSEFSAEEISDGNGIPEPLRQQAMKYLTALENPEADLLDPDEAILKTVSLDFIKPLLPVRDSASLQKLIDHGGEPITSVLTHADYVSLRRQVRKLPDRWSLDDLRKFADEYLQRLSESQEKDRRLRESEAPTELACTNRDDSFRFGRAVLPVRWSVEDLELYSDLVQNFNVLAAVRKRRQADFEREVRGIPSGLPLHTRKNSGRN
jgi:hypothetical protein